MLWTCPKCGADFVQRNLSHSCGRFTVEEFLAGKSEKAIRLFWIFVDEWKQIGNIKLHPVKTSVSIMNTVRFARVNRVKRDSIVCHLWLKKKVKSHKFFRVEKLLLSDYIHHFEITDESFIDDEFRRYMKMAYEVGRRK